jgi:hypothetical protein
VSNAQQNQSAEGVFGLITDYSLHVVTAIVGSMSIGAIAALLVWLIWNVTSPHSDFRVVQATLLQRPFPLQLTSAVFLGWVAAPRLRAANLAKWTWVVPSLLLLVRLLTWKSTSLLSNDNVFSHFLGACSRMYCADQFTVTLPFYASLAYSIAAVIRVRKPHSRIADSD